MDADRQLQVYGLPEARFQWREREKALQKLVSYLRCEEIGDQGINLEQRHIIGAHHTWNKDGQKVTILTVDSKETKGDIRRAATEAKRWGAKSHTVFLRDTISETPTQRRSRSSSNEDRSSSKRQKTEEKETPRSPRSSRSPRPSRSKTEKDHRNRTEGRPEEPQTKKTAKTDELERLKLQRLEARRAKIERQDRDDKAIQEEINRQGKRQRELERVNPKATIQTFKALNENENKNRDDWRPKHTKTDQEPTKRDTIPPVESETESETQEGGTQMEESDAGSSSGESIELKNPETLDSDYEYKVEDEEEIETEGEEVEDDEEEIAESSPERRVILRNPRTASQKRNKRRRLQRKHKRDREIAQTEEDEQDTIVPRNKESNQRR